MSDVMNEFVDLRGASGAAYRFKLLRKGETPLRIAGNYAILRVRAEGHTVVHLGMTDDLSKVREEAPAMTGRGPFHVYVRLNIARSSREGEHADMAVRHDLVEMVAAE